MTSPCTIPGTHLLDRIAKNRPLLDRLNTATRTYEPLPPDEVHVWVARLDEIACRAGSLEESLSAEESQRAGRFHSERDRARYSAGLGVLRSILGFYLGTNPGEIEFGREKKNKPVLSGKFARTWINFNLSRSKGLALYVFARNRSLGVDIEKVEPMPDMDWIVRRFFSSCEIQDYNGLPANVRPEAFFRCWTRKEAFLKATGEGLSRPLNSFSVSLLPGEPPRITETGRDRKQASEWFVLDLPLEGGYSAAVVVDGPSCSVHCRYWPDDFRDGSFASSAGDLSFTPGGNKEKPI